MSNNNGNSNSNGNGNGSTNTTSHDGSDQQLYPRQKLDVIGQLAGNVAHNFNNQLTGIVGFANLIRMRASEPNIKKFAEEILGICKNSGDMVRELLTFARYRPPPAVGADVGDAVETTARLLASGLDKNIAVKHIHGCGGVVPADPAQLQTALLNIALVLKDAMPRGGAITISTKHAAAVSRSSAYAVPALDELWNAMKPNAAGFVKIDVANTGGDLDEDAARRMFDPPAEDDGRDELGLCAVCAFARSAGGAVDVSAAPGAGTTLTLVLPHYHDARTRAPNAKAGAANGAAQNNGNGTILLADDDAGIRDGVGAFLRGQGYNVTTADNGVDAVEKYAAADGAVDLVILDLMMPRMNGKEAFMKMKEMNGGVRVIGITGYNNFATDELVAAGMKQIMHKPFNFHGLLEVVKKYCRTGIAA